MIRDVIAISSLPSVWAQYTIKQLADSLVETVHRCLNLQFVVAVINGENQNISTGYAAHGFLVDSMLAVIKDSFIKDKNFLTISTESKKTIDPLSGNPINIFYTPIGHNYKNGVILAASVSPEFPTDSDKLLLNLMCNQTNVMVESKWLQQKTEALLVQAEENKIHHSEAKKAAEAANELKTSFLANMSHEIRTPLGAILGFADVLKNPNLTEMERAEYLEVITRSGQSLSIIIDDILDLSKIEADKLEIEYLPLSISRLLKEVVAMFSERAHKKGIRLILDETGLPKFSINSDQVRIRQILVNLIGNAVKFTSQGTVTVTGYFDATAEGKVLLRLQVKDTGIGVSNSVANTLFQPFVQGDNQTTRKYGGTGLGLIISKKLAQALGGDVNLVASETEKGSEFEFRLSAEKSNTIDPNHEEKKVSASNQKKLLKGLRILVVDDSIDNRLLMEVVLTSSGAHVEFAENGEEAVQKSLKNNYDLVLMDIQMPILDGFGALRKLQQADYKKPVFALTAHAMKEERMRALESGFAEHVPKPINAAQLLEAILAHVAPTAD